jgi:hypothetical protein
LVSVTSFLQQKLKKFGVAIANVQTIT